MWKKILVAYDGSVNADKALTQAIDLAKVSHAEVAALMVVEYPGDIEMAAEDYLNSATSTYQEKYAAALGQRPPLDKTPVLEMVLGPPVDIMLGYITKNDVDLLVIGTSHKSLLDKFMLGSVSTAVLKRAPCSVLLVRD